MKKKQKVSILIQTVEKETALLTQSGWDVSVNTIRNPQEWSLWAIPLKLYKISQLP